ncbi:MAG: membrane protein insertion efficiency factor YidD [Candidatus Latescibacteria bacterium]|nr:membrane protein insertion efficiency factor YidD [Candidatus Latescibacterota bacterium]
MRNAVIAVIRFYQKWISPMMRPRCRFLPTCSEYTMLAVQKFGILRGLLKGLWRVLKCHPLYRGELVDFP